MKFNSQIYLNCYSNLHSSHASKQANKTLLEIYQSDDAWKIAEELLQQQTYMIHGSQLLSQKLNSSLPADVNPQVLAQFILSIKHISNLHWLCLAKLFVHTHQTINNLKLQGSLGIDVKLNILKEIPHAIGQMRIQFGIKSNQYKSEVFRQNKFLILESIQFLQENKINQVEEVKKLKYLVLQTLESFTQHQITLNSKQIASFVLSLSESDKASNLLQHLFLEESYPDLQVKLQTFLNKNIDDNEKEWIKSFYLNFYAKKNIFETFTFQKYSETLRTATLMMNTDDDEDFRMILSDSYEFWLSQINNLSGNQNKKFIIQIEEKKKILKDCLFSIYQALCKHSQLKKCPSQIKSIESNLDIIDLDNNLDMIQSNINQHSIDQFSEINFNVNQIRQMSIDLLIKVQQGLKTDINLYKKMFQFLFMLTSNHQDSQTLQLLIFIVDGMTDFCDQFSTPYLSQLIKVILEQKSRFNEYICQRIVILLGKIDKIVVSNPSMLSPMFQFFSNSILYQKLSSLASQSFTDLMDQYQIHNFVADQQFKQKSQTYLNLWFQTFYGKLTNQKVLQNITKALVIFIYKFKGPQFYEKFLLMMNQKIKITSDPLVQDIYLQAVVTGENWINSKQSETSQQYLIIFANFMNQFCDIMVENCFKVNRKPDFTKAISKLNWALKAGCYFTNINKWLEQIKNIIKKSLFESQTEILPVGLTPLITLLKIDKMSLEHLKAIFKFLEQILIQITQLFIKYHQNKTTLDYNFSKYIIQMHNLTINLLLKYRQSFQGDLIFYEPGLLFEFIKLKIFKNKTFWEYEVYKESLIFLNQLILSDYKIDEICFEVLEICGRTLQSLWIQTQNIFLNVYKKVGISAFENSLTKIKPEILNPNPLFSILQEGLQKSDRKMLKNFVRCL